MKKYCPHAKQLIHQTWAYETGSQKLANQLTFATDEEMFAEVEKAYNQAANTISADGIIPAGKAMMTLAKTGIPVHRDTFHANLGYGRYLLALVWFKYLTGQDITENQFNDFDVPVTDEERKAVIDAVNAVL